MTESILDELPTLTSGGVLSPGTSAVTLTPNDSKAGAPSKASLVECTPATDSEPIPCSYPRWLKTILLITFATANFLDASGVSVLFPTIPVLQKELGYTGNEAVWLLSAYSLTFASSLLLSGRMSDVYNPSKPCLITVFWSNSDLILQGIYSHSA